jgi:hypothetical protein
VPYHKGHRGSLRQTLGRDTLISETAKFSHEEELDERRTAGVNRARVARVARSQQGDVQGWPGPGRIWVPPATVYQLGRRAIEHIHDTGVADLVFPKEIHDELISDGRAKAAADDPNLVVPRIAM